MGVGPSTSSVALPAPRRRGRPARKHAAVSFFSVDAAANLLRTSPTHLRDVLSAGFSFFRDSKRVGDVWQISSRDLERLLGTDQLRPMLRVSEVAHLMRTTRAVVHGAIRRGELRAVRLFNDQRPGALRLNWLTVARALQQDQGGLGA